MLTIHHLENSRSQRVIWLLEELQLEYEVVTHRRDPESLSSPDSLNKIHPLGKAPVLCDGEFIVAETGAIFEYILENYGDGRLEPAKKCAARVDYLYWIHFADGSLMPYLAMKLVFAGIDSNAPLLARPIVRLISRAVNKQYLDPNMRAELEYIENHLQRHAWFSGAEFSAADILMGFLLEAAICRLADVSKYPGISAFVDCIRARPAYQNAAIRGNWSTAVHKKHWSGICLQG